MKPTKTTLKSIEFQCWMAAYFVARQGKSAKPLPIAEMIDGSLAKRAAITANAAILRAMRA